MLVRDSKNINKVSLLVLLFCLPILIQLVNRTAFTHIHITSSGEIVTHAHPYNKSNDPGPYKKHHHSSYEYVFFEQSEILFGSITLLLIAALISFSFGLLVNILKQYFYHPVFSSLGRAPPIS